MNFNANKTNRLDLSIDLVEDMVTQKGHFNNSCMVLEIRELMETNIIQVLLRGQSISLKIAFEHAWMELTDQDIVDIDSFLELE